jgi:hypothetical protein
VRMFGFNPFQKSLVLPILISSPARAFEDEIML